MRELEIRTWVKQIRGSFKAPHPLVDIRSLHTLYKKRAYTAMVGHVQKALKLSELSLTVGYVNSGGPPRALAWVRTPIPMPAYGSTLFKELKIPLFFRKEFLEKADFPLTVMAMAHELSHVVLESIGHPLKQVEEVVDLTAMHLGFRHVYIAPNVMEFLPDERSSLHQRLALLLGNKTDDREVDPHGGFGYMSFAERKFAAGLMGTNEPYRL